MMRFQELPEPDRADLLARLKRYDLDEKAIADDALVVRRDSRMVLSRKSEGSLKPRVLKTKDLDVVRKWIGMPEPVLKQRYTERPMAVFRGGLANNLRVLRRGVMRHPSVANLRRVVEVDEHALAAEVAAVRDVRKLGASRLDEIHLAARAYIQGDYRPVKAYKKVIEALFKEFEIPAWVFTTIKVGAGATLHVSGPSSVLSAWKIELGAGASIVSNGHLNVDCTVLEQQ